MMIRDEIEPKNIVSLLYLMARIAVKKIKGMGGRNEKDNLISVNYRGRT